MRRRRRPHPDAISVATARARDSLRARGNPHAHRPSTGDRSRGTCRSRKRGRAAARILVDARARVPGRQEAAADGVDRLRLSHRSFCCGARPDHAARVRHRARDQGGAGNNWRWAEGDDTDSRLGTPAAVAARIAGRRPVCGGAGAFGRRRSSRPQFRPPGADRARLSPGADRPRDDDAPDRSLQHAGSSESVLSALDRRGSDHPGRPVDRRWKRPAAGRPRSPGILRRSERSANPLAKPIDRADLDRRQLFRRARHRARARPLFYRHRRTPERTRCHCQRPARPPVVARCRSGRTPNPLGPRYCRESESVDDDCGRRRQCQTDRT